MVVKPEAPRFKIVPIASKSNNSVAWTPETLVKEFLADLQAGKIKPKNLMFFFMEDTDDGNMRPSYYYANMNRAEEIALLTLAIHKAIDLWRNSD
jgi:hypothetical protein